MEITERWVGQAAGGRVFKDARALVRLGKVAKAARRDTGEGAVFQGLVGSGGKPMRVVVKVTGPTSVKNLCGCTMARRTSAMCEHAAAVLLASIQPEEPAKQDTPEPGGDAGKKPPAHPPVPLEVRLSPRFPGQGANAVHLRRASGANSSASTTEQALTDWLVRHAGRADAAMLSLPDGQLGSFYRALHLHPRVSSGGRPVAVLCGTLRPPVLLELEGETVWLKLADCDEALTSLGGILAAWDVDAARLTVADGAVSLGKLGSSLDLDSLLTGDWYQVPVDDFVKSLEPLDRAFQLPDDLGGLAVREAVPEIRLELAGSTRALQARLSAVYSADAVVPIASPTPAGMAFPVPDPDAGDASAWLVRNPDYEQQVAAKMLGYGFQILDASGMMFLRGEDEVLDFLTSALPSLREMWSVVTEEELGRVESRLERIVPQIDVQGSGTDWLACDLGWQAGGKQLGRDAVGKLLQSGSRTLSLPGGRKAVVSRYDAEVMEGFLLDTDPRQEGGKFYFPGQQRGYIDELRAHYGKDGKGKKPDTTAVPSLPDKLGQTLRPYQQEGVDWLFRKVSGQGAALLADDMGLGKTLQTLALVRLWKDHRPAQLKGPVLVVCPATLLGNWCDEAKRFVSGLHVLVMHGPKRKDYFGVMGAADIIITSYALADRDSGHYAGTDLAAVILDEASAIRNPDTLAAKAVRKIAAASPDAARIAITGTPVENSVRDLWSVFQFLMPGYLGGREDFRRRYELPCAAEMPDYAALQRLRWRTSPFMLRRTKSVVAKDLPPKIESVVWCEPTPAQRDQYQSILRHGTEKVDQLRRHGGKDGARMQVLTVLLRLRQACCDLRLLDESVSKMVMADASAKLARLMELLDEAERGGHRVLVFSQFTSMLALIRAELEGTEFCYLDGSTKDRADEVVRFQKPDGPPVFLISLKAGGYGLTLTAADTVVLFDPWWNPAVEAQAADRIHRIGQTKPATIYKLITRGTVEEKILRLQEKKRAVITAAMGEESSESGPLMSGLTEAELLELLDG